MDENEYGLMDYFNVIWKRKWLIIIPTFVLLVAVGVYSFFLPPVWEVDALIVPSKVFAQTTGMEFAEFVFVGSKQIAEKINEGSYREIIANELNLDIRSIPELRAENLEDTKLIRISTREKDVEKAKLILSTLLNHLKKELDAESEIEKLIIEEEIKAFKKKLSIVRQRIKEIEKEMSDTRKRIELLKKEQRLSLKKEKRSEFEILRILLYSNETQQTLKYYELNELLSNKKIEEENIKLEIKAREEKIKGIDFSQIVKKPTSSFSPVAPKKKRNILIAGILGLMIFTLLAFFLEYIEKQKLKG